MSAPTPDGAKLTPQRVEPLTPEEERELREWMNAPQVWPNVGTPVAPVDRLFATLDAARADMKECYQDLSTMTEKWMDACDRAERAEADEQARWQARFEWLSVEYGVDGGFCDSGDPLDFTESEVRQALTKLTDERDEARKWAEDTVAAVVAARVVTCVYCGHEYPAGTPTSQDAALTEHIRTCAKHPMRTVEAALAEERRTRLDSQELYERQRIMHAKIPKRPILYTDVLGENQVCRDDLWAVTTEELNALAAAVAERDEAKREWESCCDREAGNFEEVKQLRADLAAAVAEREAWRTAFDHYFGPYPMDEKADALLREARRLRAAAEGR